MQAVLQLVAATQRREIDGANLLDTQKRLGEPLEIKPLAIAPLKIVALDDDAAPPQTSRGSETRGKSFVVADRSD